uniref:Uncharacterized protein n=1 Tax=Erpetoichthys calabaricus TaxID=27687 RepID=A0A8C4TD74_ERPCA
ETKGNFYDLIFNCKRRLAIKCLHAPSHNKYDLAAEQKLDSLVPVIHETMPIESPNSARTLPGYLIRLPLVFSTYLTEMMISSRQLALLRFINVMFNQTDLLGLELDYLIEILALNRWYKSMILKLVSNAEVPVSFYVTYSFVRPEQVARHSNTKHSLGRVFKDQVIIRRDTLIEIVCSCNALQAFSVNDTMIINICSLHGYAAAIHMSFIPCKPIVFGCGHFYVVGRRNKDTQKCNELAENLIQYTSYHICQSQMEVNLSKETIRRLTCAFRSAEYVLFTLGGTECFIHCILNNISDPYHHWPTMLSFQMTIDFLTLRTILFLVALTLLVIQLNRILE